MVSPDSLTSAFSGMWQYNFGNVMRWVGYFLYTALVTVVGFVVYIYIQYKYKVSIRDIEGNSISKPKWDRARSYKKHGVLKWKLLIRRKEIKPVDFEYIYPGKRVYLLRSGINTFIPMRQEQKVAVDGLEGVQLVTSIKPLDEDVTYWYQLQQKEIAKDYEADDAGKKQLLFAMGTVILCLAACVITIYIIYKNLQPLTESINNLAQTSWIKNAVEGIAPN